MNYFQQLLSNNPNISCGRHIAIASIVWATIAGSYIIIRGNASAQEIDLIKTVFYGGIFAYGGAKAGDSYVEAKK